MKYFRIVPNECAGCFYREEYERINEERKEEYQNILQNLRNNGFDEKYSKWLAELKTGYKEK